MESRDQLKLLRWCKERGLVARKLVSPSARGFPDCMIGSPVTKRLMFLEMKAPNGRLSLPQMRTISHLASCGVFVGVPLSFEQAKKLIIDELRLET